MNVQLSGHHVEVTPAIRDYLTEKLSRVRRHFDQVIDIHATFSADTDSVLDNIFSWSLLWLQTTKIIYL